MTERSAPWVGPGLPDGPAGASPGPRLYRYGPHPAQVAELYPPVGPALPVGVAVLVHGGFWRARYDRSLEHRVAADLVGAGWAVWNVDYRGVDRTVPGPDGGGWPYTYQDVAAAADLLVEVAEQQGLPLTRVVAIGHSAGGALALWLAGAAGRLRLHRVVAQAGVCDLREAYRQGLGAGAVGDLFGGGPDDDASAAGYRSADPVALLPLRIPTLLVVSDADHVVPPSVLISYATAARTAGDQVDVWRDRESDHLAHVDPGSPTWHAVRVWLDTEPAGGAGSQRSEA